MSTHTSWQKTVSFGFVWKIIIYDPVLSFFFFYYYTFFYFKINRTSVGNTLSFESYVKLDRGFHPRGLQSWKLPVSVILITRIWPPSPWRSRPWSGRGLFFMILYKCQARGTSQTLMKPWEQEGRRDRIAHSLKVHRKWWRQGISHGLTSIPPTRGPCVRSFPPSRTASAPQHPGHYPRHHCVILPRGAFSNF